MPQWISDIISVSPVLGAFCVAGFLGALVWKYLRPPTKGIEHFLEDWNGEPERPGVPGRPGMMERVANIETSQTASATHQSKADAFFEKYGPIIDKLDHEMHPNSGSSLADAVNRTEKKLDDHIESCPAVQTNITVTTPGV
jgi:hypothetical protein